MSQISQLSKLSIVVSITVTVTVTLPPPSLPQLLPVPQQPNHVVCHIILWLVGVVPFSTNRKGSSTVFFLLADTSCLWTLLWKKPIFIVSSCTKHTANMTAMFYQQKTGIKFEGHANIYVRTETHGGCVLLLRHLKLATWFGRTGASVDSGGGAWSRALQWLALVRTWLWWLWLTMLAKFGNHIWNHLITVSL